MMLRVKEQLISGPAYRYGQYIASTAYHHVAWRDTGCMVIAWSVTIGNYIPFKMYRFLTSPWSGTKLMFSWAECAMPSPSSKLIKTWPSHKLVSMHWKKTKFPWEVMIPTLSTCYDPRRKARGNTLAATKALTRASPVVVQAVHGRAEALVAILNWM